VRPSSIDGKGGIFHAFSSILEESLQLSLEEKRISVKRWRSLSVNVRISLIIIGVGICRRDAREGGNSCPSSERNAPLYAVI